MREGRFDWDNANRNHLARHRISVQEAEEVLLGFCAREAQEPIHGEARTLALGTTAQGRFLTIAYTERAGKIRPITGWAMTRQEMQRYAKELENY